MKTFTIEDFKKWGAQGGKKKGKSKVRGDSEYYRNISKKRFNSRQDKSKTQ